MMEKQLQYKDGSKVWFTSDTHFGHKNVIEYSSRPFETTDEMFEVIKERWNAVVGEDDTVFHLGDVAWGKASDWQRISELNGHKILVLGNHDPSNMRPGYMSLFDGIYQQLQILVEDRTIYLNHFPFLVYGGMHREWDRGVWQLHGHVHSGPGLYRGKDIPMLVHRCKYQYDVGVDNNNFTPVNFKQVESIIREQYNAVQVDEDNAENG